MAEPTEELALRLAVGRLAETQLLILRALDEQRVAHARELTDLRTAHAAALAGIETELQRHREAEATQAGVVASYAASLEADRKALAELRAVKADGRAGLLTLLSDQRVISALIAAGAAIAAYLFGASSGTAAPPP